MKRLDEGFWLEYFKVYDTLNNLIPYQEVLSEIVDTITKDNLKVLDLGCGTGNLTFSVLRKYGSKVELIDGVDFSKYALKIAKEKSNDSRIRFKQSDLRRNLPYASNRFNVVVMNNVLYTLDPDVRQALLDEIYRVLEPNGIVILSNINVHFKPAHIYKDHINKSIKNKGLARTMGDVFRFIIPSIQIFYYNHKINKEDKRGSYSFLRKNEQRELLKNAGFKNIASEKTVYSGCAFLTSAKK